MREYSLHRGEEVLALRIRHDHPDYQVVFDSALTLPRSFIDQFIAGTKKTTTKYKSGTLRLPRDKLPVIERESNSRVGTMSYNFVVVKAYSELTEEDAMNDGFRTLDDLKAELSRAYGDIRPEELLSIHCFARMKN